MRTLVFIALTLQAAPVRSTGPGMQAVDAFATTLGKSLRSCDSNECLAEAESQCKPAHRSHFEVPGRSAVIFIDEFVVPTKVGCEFVVFRDFTSLDGGVVARRTCKSRLDAELPRAGACTAITVFDPRRGQKESNSIILEGVSIRDAAVYEVLEHYPVHVSGFRLELPPPRVVLVAPNGREALLQPDDVVGNERARFKEWHEVPARACADFIKPSGELMQVCRFYGQLGDW
jgi:hypothetical protein